MTALIPPRDNPYDPFGNFARKRLGMSKRRTDRFLADVRDHERRNGMPQGEARPGLKHQCVAIALRCVQASRLTSFNRVYLAVIDPDQRFPWFGYITVMIGRRAAKLPVQMFEPCSRDHLFRFPHLHIDASPADPRPGKRVAA